MRRATATPCPVKLSGINIIEDTYAEDTTTNIEFTTAFKASFRHVKPKRGQIARRGTTNFVIHEDEQEGRGTAAILRRPTRGPLSQLSQPARRVPARAIVQDDPCRSQKPTQLAHVVQDDENAKPRVPFTASDKVSMVFEVTEAGTKKEEETRERKKSHVHRPARRKTLYVPPDATTQPTMWMDIFSPVKNEVKIKSKNKSPLGDAQCLADVSAPMTEKRKQRVSTFSPKPKRVPLGSNLHAQETAGPPIDRPGAPTGKENLPPGQNLLEKDAGEANLRKNKRSMNTEKDLDRRKFLTQARLDKLSQPKSQSTSISPNVSTMYEVGKHVPEAESPKAKRSAWNAGPRLAALTDGSNKQTTSLNTTPTHKVHRTDPAPTNVPTRFVQPILRSSTETVQHVPIIEHIENPAMYEEDWLGQQEIAITQLLNSLFSQTQSKRDLHHNELRAQLLVRYNAPEVNLLYTRVQAAILYGSLSLTHEAIFQLQNLVHDVGRKQKFIRFWLDNYNHDLLKTALEVVTGKQFSIQDTRRASQPKSAISSSRVSITRFIETFLLRHEEAHFKLAGTGSTSNDLGTKTILKSLMLLKALDMLKEGAIPLAETCLFRCDATIKSSVLAVPVLMQMLNPTIGDSGRALRQLGYDLHHEQQPLEEVTYHINNIAVDLRDGVLLTHLVEILLYKSTSELIVDERDKDDDTILMPGGETIPVTIQNVRPLSKHLKIPCNSRVARLWNVQIALGALANVRNIGTVVEDISAEDIVDGYREKTIKLLWTLVARFGLTSFMERVDLTEEIRRLDPSWKTSGGDSEAEQQSQLECERLLKEWTKAIALSRGIPIRNFTTSFSDGRVFQAILDEYEPYLIDSPSIQFTLDKRLLRLGCSRHFCEIFSTKHGQVHIFGKEFVLAALAFLCSRLVGPSRYCRKAIVIQRCWRAHWQALQDRRQAIKRDLAQACAASVNLKQGSAHSNTGLDPADQPAARHQRSEIEEDIWLSL